MLKQFLKRRLSLLLALVLVFSLLVMPASAENVNTGVTGLTADSSGKATWTASGGTITGSVTASVADSCNGPKYTAQTGTLTFTNSSGGTALLSFNYTVSLAGGSATVDGVNAEGGSFSKALNAGDTVAVAITSNDADSTATTITISNLKLTAEANVDVTFKAPTNGSYTVDGAAVSADTVKTVKTTDSVALAATAASGYKFYCWYSNTDNAILSMKASDSLSFNKDQEVVAKFVPSSTPFFGVGTATFIDLNEAINYAVANNQPKIALLSNGTLPAGEYTIPSGKTLVIPFDEAQTVFTTAPSMTLGSDGKPAAHVNPSAFRTLTMASGANITVASGGALCVPSMVSAVGTNSGSWNATPTGKHGRINMNAGSSIDVQSGGKLYAWGYVAGSGSVYARSGAEIWECFQIRCWRGGTATLNMAGNSQKVFPLNQYYVQNIEAPITYYPGATEKVFAAVNFNSKQFGASATFIGTGGMFQISNGTATKRFTGASDRLELSVDGDFAIQPMSLIITGLPLVGKLDLNTADYVLPIQSNITIKVNSGTTTFSQDVAFLPGSEMIIASGAAATIANDHKAYVYDKDQWGAYAASGLQLVPVGYSTVNGTAAKRSANSLVDAKIDVNGTLNAAGQLYTTESGAAIVSSQGTGVFWQQANPGTETNTYMATQSGSDMTYVSIPITPARLQNADETYVETAGKLAGTEIPYSAGRWGGELAEITVKFDANGGTGTMPDASVTAGETFTFPDGSAFTAPEGMHFAGWTSELTGDQVFAAGAEFTIPEDITITEITLKANWAINTYTVKWLDEEGNILETDESVPYGTVPTYDGATPTKEATASATYTFSGWSPAVAAVTGDVSYTAQFTEAVRTYTVTWKDEDGTTLATAEVAYGEMPVYNNGVNPVKAADQQYTYTFKEWSPVVAAVSADATYTATYDKTVNKYTVTWLAEDGKTVLATDEVAYGSKPVYNNGVDPVKDDTAQFDYEFAGWVSGDNTYASEALPVVTDDIAYKASFSETVRTYTVTWVNDDGTVLETDADAVYGSAPSFDGETPSKAADAQYTYYFNGWTPAVADVTGDVTYTATYSQTVNDYAIKFVNWDGTELQVSNVAYGETPAYTGDTPTKAPDAQYTYSFSGWGPVISVVTGEATYTAQFSTTVNKYTITWKNEDGTLIQTDSDVEYGTNLFSIKPADPAKPNPDILKDYVFTGWVPETGSSEVVGENDIVTGGAIFVATFAESDRVFTYQWFDGTNPEPLYTTTDVPNQSPEYKGPVPTKEATAQYAYEFANDWQRTDDLENGVVTFTAKFNEVLRQYVITFKNYDGTVLQADPIDYGAMPFFGGETPTKPGNAQYSYEFSGWDPAVVEVTGEATYTAQFTESVNAYTITWKNWDGSVLETDENVPYGETPEFNSTEPVKPADEENTYTFTGWDPAVSTVTGDVEYTAQFSSETKSYTVRFLNWDGSELQSGEVLFGVVPAYNGETPTRDGTAQYSYEFSGWTPELAAVTGEATYTAQFEETVNKYTVKFVGEDGAELQSSEVEYGQIPVFNGETPAKAETARFSYEFSGWTPAIETVTGEATYTAAFTKVGKNGLCVEGEDTYWIENGENVPFPGLIRIVLDDGTVNYYYFGEDGKAVKDGTFKVEKNNGERLPAYNYNFDANGVIEHDADTSKNGICEGDGSVFYYIDGVKVGEGLLFIDGSYYYARTSNAEIVRGRSYYVAKTNGLPIEAGEYRFDADGKMMLNGFVDQNGKTYYYDNGTRLYGFQKVGEDYYFFNAANGSLYKSTKLWVGANDYGLEPGYYDFGADGKMVVAVKNGLVEEGGATYGYDNGIKLKGLQKIGDDYYFFNKSSGKMYKDAKMWVGENDYGFEPGYYDFGADGKMIVPAPKNGFVEENGATYYYIDGELAKGLTKIGDDYYFFNKSSGKLYKGTRLWVGPNEYGIVGGMYDFDADGKMIP